MSEIKKELVKLKEGETYTCKSGDEYVITEAHTLSDILRFCVAQMNGDKEDILYIVNEIEGAQQ